MQREIETLVDIRTSDLLMSEFFTFVDRWMEENPGREVWLDGDRMALVAFAE